MLTEFLKLEWPSKLAGGDACAPGSKHARITLNRPEKQNALSAEMFEAFNEYLNDLENDENLRAMIITGAGDRAFCSGTDISELHDGIDGSSISQRGQALCNRIENFPVPVIAAINGIAAGGGLELALACHMRIASTTAVFSLPESKLSLIPGYGGTQRLSREVGVGRAVEIMLTGRSLTSDEALACGLVNRVVPLVELPSAVAELLEQIEQLSPLSIRSCLQAVTQGLQLPLEEGLKLETTLFAALFDTDDAREGTTAFLEKRVPVFKGR